MFMLVLCFVTAYKAEDALFTSTAGGPMGIASLTPVVMVVIPNSPLSHPSACCRALFRGRRPKGRVGLTPGSTPRGTHKSVQKYGQITASDGAPLQPKEGPSVREVAGKSGRPSDGAPQVGPSVREVGLHSSTTINVYPSRCATGWPTRTGGSRSAQDPCASSINKSRVGGRIMLSQLLTLEQNIVV